MEEGFIIAVKEKMAKDGITNEELAKSCGYVTEVINRLLERDIRLKLDMAATIAANLGLSLDEICGIIRRE